MSEMKPNSAQGERTRTDIARAEPGWDRFERFYRRGGTTDQTIAQYAKFLGAVRTLSSKPFLKLTEDELGELDIRLLERSVAYRAVLRMFFKANGRSDLRDSMPRQRRPVRRTGLDDVLTPEDVTKLIDSAGNLRDKAIIAVLASTGGRINEVLHVRLKDIKQVKGDGYQIWFGTTKVKGQERYGHKIEGVFKDVLDAWLEAHPSKGNPDAWLFPSTGVHEDAAITDNTTRTMLQSVAERANVSKGTNPHAFRHARYTWGILNGEDQAKLNTCQWGSTVSMMAKRYSHFNGLDVRLEAATPVDLQSIPALPTPPVLSTQARVAELTARLEAIERGADGWIRERAKALGLSAALEQSAAQPRVLSSEQKAEVVARRARRARRPSRGS